MLKHDQSLSRKHKNSQHKSIKPVLIKLEKLIEFYDLLSDLISWNGHIIFMVCKGKKFIMKTELIDSVVHTLSSIKCLIEVGHYRDTNVLIRKCRDDLFLYLYLVEVVNRQSTHASEPTKHEMNAVKWMENDLEQLKISEILQYLIKNNQVIKAINNHGLRTSWEKISKNLNDFVHANGREFSLLNFVSVSDKVVSKLSITYNKVRKNEKEKPSVPPKW